MKNVSNHQHETAMAAAMKKAGVQMQVLSYLEGLFVHTAVRRLCQEEGASREHLKLLVDIGCNQYEGTEARRDTTARTKPGTTPYKEPSVARKKAERKARDEAVAAIFMEKIGGRELRAIRYCDLDSLADNSEFEMRVASKLKAICVPDNPKAKLPTYLKPAEVTRVFRESKKV